jgi:hypothetical protein
MTLENDPGGHLILVVFGCMGGEQEKKPCKYPLTLNKLFFYHFVERNFASLLTSRKKQEPF